MEYHSYESVFEKKDKLYTRISFFEKEDAKEIEKRLGWTLIKSGLNICEAIKVCEEHNKPILEERIRR